MNLKPAIIPPFFKWGVFGNTGSGKTFTASKVMAQFVKNYLPESRLVMYDSEPSAGFVAKMIKDITGKELLVCTSRSFSDLMEFTEQAIKEKNVILIDSITHPWRTLCDDFLEAKKSRVQAAGGRPESAILSLKDWNPIKTIWARFTELFAYSPCHICIVGREGDVWESVTDDEGNEKTEKTGVKMKTETECGYEPSLLVNMKLVDNKHLAFVPKDRFDCLTGKTSKDKPDIEFFKPHIQLLNIGGQHIQKSEGKKIFENSNGMNYETIKAKRTGLLENIKDDIMLVYPGQSTEDKKSRIEVLRAVFNTSAWTDLESNEKQFTIEILEHGRGKLAEILNKKEVKNA